jgi:DNA-binding PadR family transcriptional regulator
MGKGEFLGELEQLVLLTVVRLGPEAYGMNIRRELSARTKREVAIGAVYSALDRMERKGFLTSASTAAIAERGGRSRRCFKATRSGHAALSHSLEVIDALRGDLTFIPRTKTR